MDGFKGYKKTFKSDLAKGVLSFGIEIADNLQALDIKRINCEVEVFISNLIDYLSNEEGE